MSSSPSPIIATKPLAPSPPSPPSPTTCPPAKANPTDMPFLAASLLTIWVRSIHPCIPPHFSYAARAIAAHLPGSQERKWRLEYRQQTNTYPVVGERMVVNLIVWAWTGEGQMANWAAEIMVVLHTSPSRIPGQKGRVEGVVSETEGKVHGASEGKVKVLAPQVASVAWRFGPGSGRPEHKAKDAWKDWRMIHTTDYYAVAPTSGASKGGEQMTGNLIRLELNEGKNLTEMSILDLLLKGVKMGLGRPYEPKSAELLDRLERIQKSLEGQGKTAKSVTVSRKLRKTSKGYLPNISIAVHAKKAADQGKTNIDFGDWDKNEPAAVIIVDVWGSGKMKLMSVMYEGENPVVHYYRDQYPPPSSSRVKRAVEDVRGARQKGKIKGGGEQTVIGDGTDWEPEKTIVLERL